MYAERDRVVLRVTSNEGGVIELRMSEPKGSSTSARRIEHQGSVSKDLCSVDVFLPSHCAHVGIVNEQGLLKGGGVSQIQGPLTKYFMMGGHTTRPAFCGPVLVRWR